VTAVKGSTRVAALARLLREADRAVALTGAGISVPSGIPDYRTPGKGLWEKVDPIEVAHINVFRSEPERFWRFYGDRFQSLREKRPNAAHEALVELESRGLIKAVITQNIDMLHRRAGTRELVEMHGTIEHSSCLRCGGRFAVDDVRARQRDDPHGVPRCECGLPLKPDVVLFGEYLPKAAMQRAQELVAGADLLLCVGSSLEVHPVGGLPELTLSAGGQVALITQGPTPYDGRAAVKLDGDVVDELRALIAAL
jgi:NAD-dependent deacetylase